MTQFHSFILDCSGVNPSINLSGIFMRLRIDVYFRITSLKTNPSFFRLGTGRSTHSTNRRAKSLLTSNLRTQICARPQRFSLASPMASDEDYSNFLDKANQDTGASKASTQLKSKAVGTKSFDADVPNHLKGLEEYYISEADEPFEPVSLQWNEDDLPSEGTEASISKRMNADEDSR